ncbi:MAG TPA: hypothetical protein VMS87_10130 [Roseiarcus sp.]|nr:hypothetical protein [Roseiarcus sp.]
MRLPQNGIGSPRDVIGRHRVVGLAVRAMGASFFEQPVLNSPYEVPRYHHALDKHGQPLDLPTIPEQTTGGA